MFLAVLLKMNAHTRLKFSTVSLPHYATLMKSSARHKLRNDMANEIVADIRVLHQLVPNSEIRGHKIPQD
jgi:hypothetical protein